LAGLIEGERGRRRGFDGEVELAGVRADGGAILVTVVEELERERAE
jgi:hypothetical protein